MRFGFLVRAGNPEAPRRAGEFAEMLRARGDEVVFVSDYGAEPPTGMAAAPGADVVQRVDILVALGGDGPFLHGARLVSEYDASLLGLNFGSLGFLTPY